MALTHEATIVSVVASNPPDATKWARGDGVFANIGVSAITGFSGDGTLFWAGDGTFKPGLPTGSIIPYAAATAPTGYALCDGSAISRTTYATLFGIIATTYGVGDGSTTFNVPDLRGRIIAGYAASGGHADVSALGNHDGAALAHRRPKHTHSINSGGFFGYNFTAANRADGGDAQNPSSTAVGLLIGNDPANDPIDAAAYIIVNHIIKT